jgi:uncharacterized protein (DUF2461 family)
MSFAVVMEPHEAFIGRAMRQPNIQMKLPMRAKPLEVKPKGWRDSAIKVTSTYTQQKERKIT